MQWIEKVKLAEKLRRGYYTVSVVLAVVCFIAALSGTDGEVGFYGALIVLLFTSIAAIESVKDKPPRRRFMAGGIGLGFLVGAYLLLVSEADSSVTDWNLLAGLVFVWLVAAVLVGAVLPILLLMKPGKSRAQGIKF